MTPRGRIVIAGGTGFLGRNLARLLAEFDCEVVVLGRQRPADAGKMLCAGLPTPHRRLTDRSPEDRRHGETSGHTSRRGRETCAERGETCAERGPAEYVAWDARTVGDWAECLDGAAAVVNLAGRSVDCIKTPERQDEILRSRVEATEALGRAVRQVRTPPPVWVQMSSAHIYGDPPDVVCDEDSAFGYGLAPFVAGAWEAAFARAVLPTMRQVVLRTSFVLGRAGGALPRLAKLASWGLGGKAGHGRQGISWIHEHDMNRLFVRAIIDETMQGAYLATAPAPVSNAQFMRELRRALGMPIGLPAATWMVRIGAPLVMRTDPELALFGRYCVSRRLREEGFAFEFAEVGEALGALFGAHD